MHFCQWKRLLHLWYALKYDSAKRSSRWREHHCCAQTVSIKPSLCNFLCKDPCFQNLHILLLILRLGVCSRNIIKRYSHCVLRDITTLNSVNFIVQNCSAAYPWVVWQRQRKLFIIVCFRRIIKTGTDISMFYRLAFPRPVYTLCLNWNNVYRSLDCNEPRHGETCLCHMRTTKAHISLCIRAVWSAPLFSLPG